MEENPSRQLILQRVRNRIIEYFDRLSSYASQREYQTVAPVNVVNEGVNQWEDYVREDWRQHFVAPVFSAAECGALAYFESVWQSAADNVPDGELEQVIGDPSWERLRFAAEKARAVFILRGLMPEDVELDFDGVAE